MGEFCGVGANACGRLHTGLGCAYTLGLLLSAIEVFGLGSFGRQSSRGYLVCRYGVRGRTTPLIQ